MKNFEIRYNIGKAKYTVSYHDGVKQHKDGSPFYDIKISSNKKEHLNFSKKLKSENYEEL